MKKIEEIYEKTNHCLNCKNKPCSNNGCPLNNDIPCFINYIKHENYYDAYKTLCKTTVLPGICGRICPHLKQCEGSCIRGIKSKPVSIGEIEAFIYDKAKELGYSLKHCIDTTNYNKKNLLNKKIAVVGGGPCGLTAAAYLASNGIKVTIFEKYAYLGGLLMYGIPEFRLSKNIVRATINDILSLGIEVKYNKQLGKNLILDDLEENYDKIFLSFGANIPLQLSVDGEDLEGVYGGNELLEFNNHPKYEGKTVGIIGGGNVAIDCARTIKKLGAKNVKIIYRRSKEQMPAENKEVSDAIEEGIEFLYQHNVVKILGTKKVEKIELVKTKLIQKEGQSRLIPINIENSNYIINIDYIVTALGTKPDAFVKNLGIDLDKWGNIKIDENYKTSNDKIYAGGDIAGIKKTVAWSSFSGREAAKKIISDFCS